MSFLKVIKNVASLGVVQIVNFVFPLITIPYVSRIVGPEGYGIINYATAFIGYFTLLISYGFDLTATRRIASDPHNEVQVSAIVSEILNARVILFFVSLVLFVFSLLLIKPLQHDIIISIVLFVGCIATVISPQFLFQGMQELGVFAKFNLIKGVLNTVLVFVLIKEASDYFWLPILTVSFSISINIALVLIAKKKFNVQYKLSCLNDTLKLIVSERIIFFSTIVISLYTVTNTVVLGFFVDVKEVGWYTTSHNFLNIVNSVLAIPLSTALFPYIGRSFNESQEKGLETIKDITPIIFYLMLFASLCLFLLAPILIKTIYGHKFNNSIESLKIISFLPLITSLSNIFGIQLMLNLKWDRLFFRVTSICCAFGIILNILMTKEWGYIGTAWNCLIVECFVTFLMYITLKKKGITVFELKAFIPSNMLSRLKSFL